MVPVGHKCLRSQEKGNEDININRTTEALKTLNVYDKSQCSKKKVIVTACPFCNTMMTDGVKNKNQNLMLEFLI